VRGTDLESLCAGGHLPRVPVPPSSPLCAHRLFFDGARIRFRYGPRADMVCSAGSALAPAVLVGMAHLCLRACMWAPPGADHDLPRVVEHARLPHHCCGPFVCWRCPGSTGECLRSLGTCDVPSFVSVSPKRCQLARHSQSERGGAPAVFCTISSHCCPCRFLNSSHACGSDVGRQAPGRGCNDFPAPRPPRPQRRPPLPSPPPPLPALTLARRFAPHDTEFAPALALPGI